jgi:hypothetical protein
MLDNQRKKTLEIPGKKERFSGFTIEKSAEDTGFEPATPYGALHFQ